MKIEVKSLDKNECVNDIIRFEVVMPTIINMFWKIRVNHGSLINEQTNTFLCCFEKRFFCFHRFQKIHTSVMPSRIVAEVFIDFGKCEFERRLRWKVRHLRDKQTIFPAMDYIGKKKCFLVDENECR